MKPEELIRMSLLSSALSIFTEEAVLHVDNGDGNEYGEVFNFITYNPMGDPGEGYIDQNPNGNYNVWFEGRLTYEVERELFELLRENKKGLIGFYNKLKKLDHSVMKRKSQIFIELVLDQAEDLIANPFSPIEPQKNIKLKNNFVFADKVGNKYVINLN